MSIPVAVLEAAPDLEASVLTMLASKPTLAFNLREVIAGVSNSSEREVAARALLNTTLPAGLPTEDQVYRAALDGLVAKGKVETAKVHRQDYWHAVTV